MAELREDGGAQPDNEHFERIGVEVFGGHVGLCKIAQGRAVVPARRPSGKEPEPIVPLPGRGLSGGAPAEVFHPQFSLPLTFPDPVVAGPPPVFQLSYGHGLFAFFEKLEIVPPGHARCPHIGLDDFDVYFSVSGDNYRSGYTRLHISPVVTLLALKGKTTFLKDALECFPVDGRYARHSFRLLFTRNGIGTLI